MYKKKKMHYLYYRICSRKCIMRIVKTLYKCVAVKCYKLIIIFETVH